MRHHPRGLSVLKALAAGVFVAFLLAVMAAGGALLFGGSKFGRLPVASADALGGEGTDARPPKPRTLSDFAAVEDAGGGDAGAPKDAGPAPTVGAVEDDLRRPVFMPATKAGPLPIELERPKPPPQAPQPANAR